MVSRGILIYPEIIECTNVMGALLFGIMYDTYNYSFNDEVEYDKSDIENLLALSSDEQDEILNKLEDIGLIHITKLTDVHYQVNLDFNKLNELGEK